MSFFSSLALVYPGKPPRMTVAQLDQFASELRGHVGVEPDAEITLQLKYGDRIDQDYEPTVSMQSDESGTIAYPIEFEWDGEWQWKDGPSKPASVLGGRNWIHRAYMELGWLTSETSRHLSREHESDHSCGFWPDSLSIAIDPFCPAVLGEDEEVLCVGFIAVRFSGNGYFTWGAEWQEYAAQYRQAPPVQEALRIARKHFPVTNGEIRYRVEEALGQRFLNCLYYQPGDWVLTVNESG